MLFTVDFFWVIDPFCDEFQLVVCVILRLQCTVKTGPITNVALPGIDGYFENQAVLVAIDQYLFYFLEVAALLAFLPEFLP